MDEVWRRLMEGRTPPRRDLVPGDREGARLYEEFKDCLDQHKHHVFYAIGAVTIPWSYMTKVRLGPFVIGSIVGFLPDLLYANWRCDDKFRTFQQHCDQVQRILEQRRQQLQQQQQRQQE
ncbi:hypothetical protein VOLCADRAFT_115757 [Volvox carteri f. nagariensis]|uniref:Uncharacterized protein n=1 Tax=Volvox carteri f. nagariensis TaxID=3068 RepID=D8TI43_VOLCA|nr:uncharacterized protein VOLCADRAFT_115757 [Volvox carteri f. nagariensis]EFJ53174.1 hypothetical protein VOLCADRAFT_115757 [Volvox carteri f. nagariensis]|eukprot:XP_002946179.1 hypothetical protein VOLCADRAFT_115757 [Volvox carteri f. nagariensis]